MVLTKVQEVSFLGLINFIHNRAGIHISDTNLIGYTLLNNFN